MQSKWDIRWLRMAREVSTWSKDPHKQVGCVLVRDRLPISQGYNGFPRDIPDTDDWLRLKEIKDQFMVHAEANAVYNASRMGNSTLGATAYVYGLRPCGKCALCLAQAGITRVVMVNAHPDSEKHNLLFRDAQVIFDMCGINCVQYEMDEL